MMFVQFLYQVASAMHAGGTSQLRPIGKLEVHLFRNGKGVIDLNAEIPDGAFNLGVAKQ
jgi:hypothetical protein